MRHPLVGIISSFMFLGSAHAAEFAAALGKQGYGRCHMDVCSFFIIDESAPLGTSKLGTLYAVSQRQWDATYKMRGDNDTHEYDRPPVSISEKKASLSLVFCSKTKPYVFSFFGEKWRSYPLRPGDESSIFGVNEATYQFYFAECHNHIMRDPYATASIALAKKIGYNFGKSDTSNPPSSEGEVNPLDLLK
jgi:hypothetical protein